MTDASFQHRYAEVNGVRLHVVSKGEGPLVLFLHAFPAFWYEWRHQLDDLGRDHHAVAIDMRGYNLSSKPAPLAAYETRELVADVRELVRWLGYERCTLVGHDWGGIVGWSTAATHPEMVERLMVVNAAHPFNYQRELRDNPAQQNASAYMKLYRTADAVRVLSRGNYAVLQHALLRRGLQRGYLDDADRAAYLAAWAQPGALEAALKYYQAMVHGENVVDFRLAETMPSPNVDVPTLVLWGEDDPLLVRENLDGLERYVPRLEIRRVPDGTHWLALERPDLVTQALREHLQRT